MDPQHTRIDHLPISSAKDAMIAELLSMGFDISAAVEAVRTEGIATLADAVGFLLAGGSSEWPQNKTDGGSAVIGHGDLRPPMDVSVEHGGLFIRGNVKVDAHAQDLVGNSTIHLLKKQRKCSSQTSNPLKKIADSKASNVHTHGEAVLMSSHIESTLCEPKKGDDGIETVVSSMQENSQGDLGMKAQQSLGKYFGYSSLKPFQLEALKAWAAHQDCLVLAATGSGKSVCFQLPALLTGKVVVVISPLISLMHDQCLQLSKQGITACFLGSGQCDKTVENKAMAGMYSIVYVCPETLPRLMSSLKQLACKRGIALFAIDEAHCISKWGHDFRPAYRRLSVLRETFQAPSLPGLKDHIPIMALTATATNCVQVDILDSLKIDSSSARVVRTTLFRPNLRFSVHHSKTRKLSSYKEDFKGLIEYYAYDSRRRSRDDHLQSSTSILVGNNISSLRLKQYTGDHGCLRIDKKDGQVDRPLKVEDLEKDDEDGYEDEDEGEDECYGGDAGVKVRNTDNLDSNDEEDQELTVNFLENEDEDEVERLGGDFDVIWNESINDDLDCNNDNASSQSSIKVVEKGPTIIYMPTRKETETLAKFLSQYGVKAASYHAKLPKVQLRKVHEQFHLGSLQVVVATIAFGMGIDKPNVRHIIHYGWPQSLEAYYQEAGRAGRDGLPSECMLYCDMTVLPSLLPSRRDPEQTWHALCMLEQCFRYGLSTNECRAGILLKYFGEDIANSCCNICDVCTMGPPPLENLTKEAEMLLTILSRSKEILGFSNTRQPISKRRKRQDDSCCNQRTFQHAVNEIAECNKISHRDHLWWRGFGRILADAGFLKESSSRPDARSQRKLVVPHLKNPEVTAKGHGFLQNCKSVDMINHVSCPCEVKTAHLCIYPEGDMIQAMAERKFHRPGAAAEWGRGWADPEIRKQRLSRLRSSRGKRQKKRHQRTRDGTVRQRLLGHLNQRFS